MSVEIEEMRSRCGNGGDMSVLLTLDLLAFGAQNGF
jgi:hypothetical protein